MTQTDLLTILGDLEISVKHIANDGWIACHCPFAPYKGHPNGSDRDASFFAKIEPQGISGYHCFTCKQAGRISGLARALAHYREENYDAIAVDAEMREASSGVIQYDERVVFMEAEPVPLPKEQFMGQYPSALHVPDAMAYLAGRGIGAETTAVLQLLYDPAEWRVLFPVFDYKNSLFGFGGRSILNKEQMDWVNAQRTQQGLYVMYDRHKDYNFKKERFLLGEQLIDKKKPILVVEGYFAFAHMVEIGVRSFANPVATFGSNLSRYQREILIDYGLPVYAFYDDDSAGDVGLYGRLDKDNTHRGGGLVDVLKKELPVMVPKYPEGISDPDNLTLGNVSAMFHNAELQG